MGLGCSEFDGIVIIYVMAQLPNQHACAVGRKGQDLVGKYLLAKTAILLGPCMNFYVG